MYERNNDSYVFDCRLTMPKVIFQQYINLLNIYIIYVFIYCIFILAYEIITVVLQRAPIFSLWGGGIVPDRVTGSRRNIHGRRNHSD